MLDAGGKTCKDVRDLLNNFGLPVPRDAQTTVVAQDSHWTVGAPNANPVACARPRRA
ncbi:hypothetical protein [Actinomadura sp. WMMA1423]|uniref:hypothetical protein n=1 Tax=Actinomadura sp. WMMA1423 TaxID=2591108 RepID=UPI00143D3C7A|nr:hypothetical protein [Actinomadura sp. WMMA1423]